jgi:uncharacterized protein (DUF2252 family)
MVVPSPSERAAAGRASRATAPRSSHADWEPAADRPDPVSLLEEQAASRVPELVPIRHGRMLTSPFSFFRGNAYGMASDLAGTPASGFEVQACGDAHLSNFGGFASPERELLFDVNDFDETLPAPWEWDLKRLGASLTVAGRQNGFSKGERGRAVAAAVGSYRKAMRGFAKVGDLEVWYARLDAERTIKRFVSEVRPGEARRVQRGLEKARTKDSMRALTKLTERVNGTLRIRSEPPLIVRLEDMLSGEDREQADAQVRETLRSYGSTLQEDRRHLLESYRVVDIAHKVVGVGSVGTRAWIVLMTGRDEGDPLFLQCKEAQRSVLEPFVKHHSRFNNQGRRVVEGQRLTQAASDMLLGWYKVEGIDHKPRDFYVRQLWDWKASADIDAMSPKAMTLYAGMCGWTLARAHARSGDRIAIAAYLGKGDGFDRAIGAFSEAYAKQNEADHGALAAAVKAGRVKAETV